ncbi:MAG: choice-of-anchor B family protein [Planctomycetota bacterium]|nr:MAG: choice-of-anchor B family protein [Planctomycetota bacterium]
MTRTRSIAVLTPALLFAAATSALADPPRAAGDEDILKLLDRPAAAIDLTGPGDDDGNERMAFDSQNMTMLAHFTLADFPGGSSSGNDCWGYVSPSGREYAIMGLERGYAYVEVTDPENAVIIDYISGPSSLWHDVKVLGEYAYGVSEGGSGIQVMDLSDIDNGNVTLVRNKTQQGHSSTHNIVANPDSGFLYLVGANIQNGGLIAVNTNDPEDPIISGAWNAMYVHDAQVVSYTEGPFAGREIAYCLSGFSGGFSQTGLRVVDVTNKNNMFTVATISWAGARYAHQGWLSEDRQYFYVNDEIDEGDSVSVTTTRVFDVSDPANPSFEGIFTTGLPATDHNLYTHNGLIFQSNYRSGLRVFDYADNPVSPTEIAYFDTYASNDGVGYNGSWSNYPYLPSGTIIISDIEGGMFLVRLEGVDLELILPQSKIDPNTPTPVTVEITETFSGYDDQTVTLNYSINDGPEETEAMAALGGGLFRASLPAASCFDAVDYYVSVTTDSGAQASSETINAFVYEDLTTVVDYNGETTSGWTVGDTGDNASTGIWNRQDPNPTDAQPGDDASDDGTNCWVTDGRGGGLGDYDVDGGKTTLKSPVYDLDGLNDPYLGVWVWYSNNTGADPNNDTFRIDFSSNGGNSWTNAKTLGPSGEFSNGGWFYHEIRVADIVTPNANFRARFVAEDAASGSIVEAAVDELSIYDYVCDGCIADFNGDGNVNTQDVLSFLNAWNAGDGSADINGDGNVNTQDVLAFLNLWNAGC